MMGELPPTPLPTRAPAPIDVTLSRSEIVIAASVGCLRQIVCLYKGERDKFDPASGWSAHVDGACGELAVAKHTGLHWHCDPEGKRHHGDVGHLEVRATPYRNGHLIMHDRDPSDRYHVLVTGIAPNLQIRGCMYGADAKSPAYWRTDVQYPAYYIAQYLLSPLEAAL